MTRYCFALDLKDCDLFSLNSIKILFVHYNDYTRQKIEALNSFPQNEITFGFLRLNYPIQVFCCKADGWKASSLQQKTQSCCSKPRCYCGEV